VETQKTKNFGSPKEFKVRTLAVSTTLDPGDNIVLVSGTMTLTLPEVSESAGETIVVFCTAGSSDVTIAAGATIYTVFEAPSQAWTNDHLTAANDIVILRNVNGFCWVIDVDITT
jgi:hypothetical protein